MISYDTHVSLSFTRKILEIIFWVKKHGKVVLCVLLMSQSYIDAILNHVL